MIIVIHQHDVLHTANTLQQKRRWDSRQSLVRHRLYSLSRQSPINIGSTYVSRMLFTITLISKDDSFFNKT